MRESLLFTDTQSIIDPFENAYFGVGEKVGNAFKDGAELKYER